MIYDFQTLLAGLLAIGAAYYAARPVWRQLQDSNLQTRIMHRDTLAARLMDAEKRAAQVAKAIDEPLRLALEVTSDPAGEPIQIDEHHARKHPVRAAGHGGLLQAPIGSQVFSARVG
ncbi:MAG: hypothetical protein ACK5SX_08740 [Sandaracinobacter sp.]